MTFCYNRKLIPFIFTSLSILILLSFSFTSILYAQESDKEIDELLNLGIGDLVGMNVSTVSKREEGIDEAPGVISVVTEDEIRRFGARSLRDVLDRVISTQIIGSTFLPFNAVSVRAGSTTHVDNHTLLLMNGRPIRDSHSGGLNLDIYANFPISMIEKIEIVRGPGSVLYGSNAYTGVVNIITKKRNEDGEDFEAKYQYGSYNTRVGQARTSIKDGDLNLNLGVQSANVGGWDFSTFDEVSTFDSTDLGHSGTHFVLNTEYKGLTLNAIIGNYHGDNQESPFRWPSNQLQIKRQFFDIGYLHEINENWDVSFNFTYQGHDTEARLYTPTRSGFGKSHGQQYELTTRGKVSKDFNVVAGAVYDRLDGNLRTINLDYDTGRYSLYAQADYRIRDNLKVFGGAQWNKPDSISGDFSPRLGAIYNFNENTGLKLLYGQAFLSAYAAQLFTNSPAFVGNPSLGPEEIETYDVQVFYRDKLDFAGLTFFYSKMTETHIRQLIPSGANTTVNQGTIDFHGIELEGKKEFSNNFFVIGNATWQESENASGQNDVTYTPNWMVKTGVSYEHPRGITVSIFNTFFDSPARVEDFRPAVQNINPEAKSYHLLTGNLIFNLDKYFNGVDLYGLTLSLYVDNILDEDINYPSFARPQVNTLPHHAGRGYFGTISMEF